MTPSDVPTLGWHALTGSPSCKQQSKVTMLYRVTHGLVDIPQDHLTRLELSREVVCITSQTHTHVMAYKHSFSLKTVHL